MAESNKKPALDSSEVPKRVRPSRFTVDHDLTKKLHAALVVEAQKEVLLQRAEEKAAIREQNLLKRELPSQAQQCADSLFLWDSNAIKSVMRAPTQKELRDHTVTYEGIALHEAKIRPASLLISAIRSRCLEVVETVIEELGPCTSLRDSVNFNAPLHFSAVLRNGKDITKVLMSHGHRPSTVNRYGWTPVDFARHVNNMSVADALTQDTDIDNFGDHIERGNTEMRDDERNCKMITTVVRSGQRDLLRFLFRLDHRNIRDFVSFGEKGSGNTALHFAVMDNENTDIVMDLLQAGADVHARNAQGRTAQILAERKGRYKFVELLAQWDSTKIMADYFLESITSPGSPAKRSLSPSTVANPKTSDLKPEPLADRIHRRQSVRAGQQPEDSQDSQGLDLDHELPMQESEEQDASLAESTVFPAEKSTKFELDHVLLKPVEYQYSEDLVSAMMDQMLAMRKELDALTVNLERKPQVDDHFSNSGLSNTLEMHGSRPTNEDILGAAHMAEIFAKLHHLQKKIDDHEILTEEKSISMTMQQEILLHQIESKLRQIAVQQKQAAQMLSETSEKIGRSSFYDKGGIMVHEPAADALSTARSKGKTSGRNPIWEKVFILDVPDRPANIVISVLDRSILNHQQTVLLGRTELSLDHPASEDVEGWHDLSVSGVMGFQHAGSIKVKQRFVPLSDWAEFVRLNDDLLTKESAQPLVDDGRCGLYVSVMSGCSCAGEFTPPGALGRFVVECGDIRSETPSLPLKPDMHFPTLDCEFFWNSIDVKQSLKVQLQYENRGNCENAAMTNLHISRLPFNEIQDSWNDLEVFPGMGKITPKVHISLYRTSSHEHPPNISCSYCGKEIPHLFQAPHLALVCPKYVISCPHQTIGCSWQGARFRLEKHLETCNFEKMREEIYATSSKVRNIQELLVESSVQSSKRSQEVSEKSYVRSLLPLYRKSLLGHKHPISCVKGLIGVRKLSSCDRSGVIKLWDMEQDSEIDHIKAHAGEAVCLHYSDVFPAKCFSGGAFPDDTLKVWDTATFDCERTMLGGGHNFSVNALSTMRYGLIGEDESCRLYSVDDSAAIRAWDVETGICIHAKPGHELGIKAVLARDGLVITGSLDMSTKLWDPQTMNCVGTLDCLGDSVMALECVDQWLLVAGTRCIRVWDIVSRKLYRTLDGSRWPLVFVDSMLFCTVHDQPHLIQVWDLSKPQEPKRWAVLDVLKGHQSEVTSLCWFQGCLVSASMDKTIRIWQAPSLTASTAL